MERITHFIGADLSKRTIDLVIHQSKDYLCIENEMNGFKKLVPWLKKNQVDPANCLLIMEHTGMYSYCLEKFLQRKGISYSKVNALDIKLSLGITRGKTDRIDAKRIACYGFQKVNQLKPHSPVSPTLERLKMLNTSRDLLVRTRTSLKTSVLEFRNIGLRDCELVIRSQLQVIKSLDKQIANLDAEIKKVIEENDEVNMNYKLLQSIKGIGPVVASNVLIRTDNFKRFQCSRKFSCYCGIAPFEYSSGTSYKGRTRVNHLANKEMKALLDLAAKSAITCDPELKAFYERRLALGKSKMSTINIIRNKLVGRMFAVVKRQTPFVLKVSEAA